MPQSGTCSICQTLSDVYECSNEKCQKFVCLDCSNDHIMPLIEYYMNTPNFPLLKCPSCGNDLINK